MGFGVVVPAGHRMRRSQDFAAAVRRGRRCGSSTVVAHLAVIDGQEPVRVGFVVNKAVGGAVTRNAVRRRLRHLVRERLDRFPAGGLLVIRALPAAAGASGSALSADVDSVLDSVLDSVSRPAPRRDRKVAVSS